MLSEAPPADPSGLHFPDQGLYIRLAQLLSFGTHSKGA